MNTRKAFINGKFVDEENCNLHISDLAILRGYAVFDFLRTVNNVPLFLEDHLDRFYNSAFSMRLELESPREELISVIHQLIKENDIGLSGIRILLTGGFSADGYECFTPNLIITQQPLKPVPPELFEKGMKVITHEYVRELPEVKTTHYVMGVWLQDKMIEQDAADVLYYKNEEVSELPRSNFFIVTNDDVVVTPARNILKGITRMKTIELARIDLEVEERVVTPQDIRYAKEAFMTSTTKRILPIVQVDEILIANGSPGKITRMLNDLFKAFETKWIEKEQFEV